MGKLRYFFVSALMIIISSYSASAQVDCTNKLGAWVWYLKLTKFNSYEALGDSLSKLGVKRLYIKVANGKIDLSKWPEIDDPSVPAILAQKGIEAWAWSYNYPGNEAAQAEALYRAAKAGYKGFVVDIEAQFDGKPTAASRLMSAFARAKKKGIEDNYINEHFPIYCTTWGNPRSHRFPISTINQYVDAFMPQTYVENWGPEHVLTLENTIDLVKEEYISLGATKPIHQVVSTEKGLITPAEVNRFLSYAGAETSIWPVPGTNTSLLLWNTWNDIDWAYDFCNADRDQYVLTQVDVNVIAHPSANEIHVEEPITSLHILNNAGKMVAEVMNPGRVVDISGLIKGKYVMSIITSSGETVKKFFRKH